MKSWAPKKWTGRHTLISGIALILATNAVALLGVYLNRSGEPESVLKLTQRELHQPYYLGMNRENSGMSLRLNWRANEKHSWSGGVPDWLDQAKMESLGFNISPPQSSKDNYRWTSRQTSKEVLLVLEMDGPAYRHALERTRENAAEQEARLAAQPGSEDLKRKARYAQDEVKHEEERRSRLFAVDAGLGLSELRARYPDRNRYAIVRAQVRPWWTGGESKVTGYIDRISVDEINVPHEYHAMLERRVSFQPDGRQSFEARVAFGQRLEPWLLGIATAEN